MCVSVSVLHKDTLSPSKQCTTVLSWLYPEWCNHCRPSLCVCVHGFMCVCLCWVKNKGKLNTNQVDLYADSDFYGFKLWKLWGPSISLSNNKPVWSDHRLIIQLNKSAFFPPCNLGEWSQPILQLSCDAGKALHNQWKRNGCEMVNTF